MNPKVSWQRITDPDDKQGRSQKVNGSGTWIKWASCEVGFELEGVWLGTQPGKKYGDFGVMKTTSGNVCFSLSKVLAKLLAQVPVGSVVAIVYLGSRATASGDGSYHLFEVYAAEKSASAGKTPTVAKTTAARVEPDEVDDEEVPY